MNEKLQSIKEEALKLIQASDVPEKLNDVRVKYLGKKGELTAVLKSMKASLIIPYCIIEQLVKCNAH